MHWKPDMRRVAERRGRPPVPSFNFAVCRGILTSARKFLNFCTSSLNLSRQRPMEKKMYSIQAHSDRSSPSGNR